MNGPKSVNCNETCNRFCSEISSRYKTSFQSYNRRWNFLCKGSSLFQSTRVLHWGEMLILCFHNIIVHFSIELNIYSNETGNISTVVILIIIIYTLFKFQQQKLSTLLKYLLCFFFLFLVFPFFFFLCFLWWKQFLKASSFLLAL